MRSVGQSVNRVDSIAKATGKAKFPGDFNLPDQLHMKILFSDRPHAIVKSIDVQAAKAMEGVAAVITAKDVPNNIYGMIIPDQPVLCGPGSTNPYGDRVRFIGDQVAIVIAETADIAQKAVGLISVDYEDLPVVSSIEDALREDAPVLHPDKESNIFCSYKIRRGNVKAAFSQCDVIVENEYLTPVQEHAYLQPEAGLAYFDEQDRITVVVGGQCAHEDQHQIAHALDVPVERIRVIYPYIGGAFGGREDVSIQIVLALGVYRLREMGINRPLKIVWSREESIRGHGKRHAYKIKSKWGAQKNGKILAAEIEVFGDGGAYAYSSTPVLGNAALMSVGPYEIPNVSVNANVVHTNNIPGAAFRGFGGPQGAFAAEVQVNKLARELGIDRVEFRMLNLVEDGSLLCVGTPLPEGVTIKPVVKALRKSSTWINRNKLENEFRKDDNGDQRLKRGIGIACGFKNVGFSFGTEEYCNARIELFGETEISHAVLYHAGAEVGQGSHSVFRQMTAEALGLPLEKVKMVLSDTGTSDYAGSVSASRMTFMAGNAIKGAAEIALNKWSQEDRPAVGDYIYHAPKTTAFDPDNGFCKPNFAYGYAAEVVDLVVDIETGDIKINKVVCANDVGKAINPMQVQGQVEGAVVQAVGYTLMENFIEKNGYLSTDTLSKYLIPTVLDVPEEVESIILEYPDPLGPFGARGMGEMPYMPMAPAIIDAVFQATGVWFKEFPLTPERILRGLGKII